MPLYVFQTSGNPFVRILIGLVSFAVLVGLGFLMLPVVLAVIAAVMVMGLVAWGWAWWKARQAGGTTRRDGGEGSRLVRGDEPCRRKSSGFRAGRS